MPSIGATIAVHKRAATDTTVLAYAYKRATPPIKKIAEKIAAHERAAVAATEMEGDTLVPVPERAAAVAATRWNRLGGGRGRRRILTNTPAAGEPVHIRVVRSPS